MSPSAPPDRKTVARHVATHPRQSSRCLSGRLSSRYILLSQPRPFHYSIGDRISLDRAYVDISAHLGGAVVEHGFDVKSTARSIIDIHQYGTRWRQEINPQKIDIPKFSASVRDENLDDGHPGAIGELDPPIPRKGGRPGSGL